jgi:hypothetical protein
MTSVAWGPSELFEISGFGMVSARDGLCVECFAVQASASGLLSIKSHLQSHKKLKGLVIPTWQGFMSKVGVNRHLFR